MKRREGYTRAARTIALFVVVVVALGACASEPKEEAGADRDRVRFLLGFVIQGVHAPWIIGQEKGFFEEEGIDLELVEGEAPSIALAGLAAGEGELASVDLIGLALATKEDPELDVRYLAPTYARSPFAFYSLRSNANVGDISDLEGKTVFAPANSIHPAILPIWLDEHGIDNVTFKEVDPASRDQLLVAGEVPVVSAFISNGPAMAEAAKKNGDELLEVVAADEGLSQLYASGIAASGSWVEENPDLTRRFLRAYVRSFEYAFDNPEETAEVMAAEYPEIPTANTVEQVRIMESLMTADGTVEAGALDPAIIDHTISYVSDALGLEDIDPESLYLEGYGP